MCKQRHDFPPPKSAGLQPLSVLPAVDRQHMSSPAAIDVSPTAVGEPPNRFCWTQKEAKECGKTVSAA